MRLDLAIVQRGLARSRTAAQASVRAGRVRVDGQVATRPSLDVADDARLEVDTDPWVSRAAHKLLGALDDFQIRVPARVLDAGASTGGFTQVCLSRGAELVHAVDVGHDQLVPELRSDPRVRVHEGLNLRDLTLDHLGERVDLVVGDVSFISLRLVLAPILDVVADSGEALLLVKPQFEVGRGGLDDHGVVKSAAAAREAVEQVRDHGAELGWQVSPARPSALAGESGNQEWFIHLTR